MTLSRGDKIGALSARKLNMLDTLIAAYERGPGASGTDGTDDARDGIVMVRNQTGADRQIGDVVGLNSPLFSTFEQFSIGLEFNGALPTDGTDETTDYTGRFAIYITPCGMGDIRPALLIGVTAARISMESPTDRYADIYPSQPRKLKSGSSGSAHILYAEPSSTYPGDVYGIVRLANPAAAVDTYTPVRNDSAYTVPPFGIMEITGVVSESSDAVTFTITRPTASCGVDKYLINSAAPIPPGQTGKGTWQLPHRIAYDPGDEANDMSPEIQWGPKVDSFYARSGPVYWEFHGLGPTTGGTSTLWVGPAQPQQFMFFTPEADEEDPDGIEAATYSGGVLTPGWRVLKVWEFNSDGELVETDQEEVVYNIDTEPVAADRVIQAKQERRTGRLIADFEPCSGLTETESEGG